MRIAFQADIDLHSKTVELLYGIPMDQVDKEGWQRKFCKAIGFGILYGMGPHKLATAVNMDEDEAAATIERWLDLYPGVRTLITSRHEEAKKQGYVINPFGRRRWVREAMQDADEYLQAQALRIAMNSPIQGAGADVCLIAMFRMDAAFRARGMQSRVIIQIHDAILIDVHPDELDEVIRLATIFAQRGYSWMNGVPLKIEWKVGHTWGDFTKDFQHEVKNEAVAQNTEAQESPTEGGDAADDRDTRRALHDEVFQKPYRDQNRVVDAGFWEDSDQDLEVKTELASADPTLGGALGVVVIADEYDEGEEDAG